MIETLGDLGDFLGGIGVIVTLVYLAVQVRQNSKLLRANTLATSASAMSGFNHLLGANPSVARVFQMGIERFPDLSEDEKRQFLNLLRAVFTDHEHVFGQWERGLADESTWMGNRQIARDLLESPYVAAWWEHRKQIFTPSFVSAVETASPSERMVLSEGVIAAMDRAGP